MSEVALGLGIVEAAAAPALVKGDAPPVAVRPRRAARWARPAKLKRMSVGTLAFMPSSSHIPVFAPSPAPLGCLPVRSRRGQAGPNDDHGNPGHRDDSEAEDLNHGQVLPRRSLRLVEAEASGARK